MNFPLAMRKLKFAGLFLGGLILGAVLTAWGYGRGVDKLVGSKEVEFGYRAAEQAELLALLRLNEHQKVIQQLESSMDSTVVALAHWDEALSADDKTRRRRDKMLVPVKVYRELYPPGGDASEQINSFLSRIPGRSPDSTCKSGICRLDDLHRGAGGANTNSNSHRIQTLP